MVPGSGQRLYKGIQFSPSFCSTLLKILARLLGLSPHGYKVAVMVPGLNVNTTMSN